MRPLALITDLDGTLFALNVDWDLIKKRLSHFSIKYGFRSSFFHFSPEAQRFMSFLDNTFDQKRSNFIKSVFNNIILKEELEGVPSGREIEGASNFLDKLHSEHIKIGVVSGNSRKTIANVINKMKWKVDEIIGREDVLIPKPNNEGVIKCLAKLQIDPKKCWAVGNRQEDIDAYKSARIGKVFFLGKTITKLSQLDE